ncbi:MAG: PspC domain-containing protein [Muribaculaceae bacterium]|nr:PspC domain-containing protein [Muribaculaceae bacterium]
MKKTFPANISGKIYYIDEDAYALLQNYLMQLRASFPGEEGREIVDDIEGRVSEIFADKIAGDHTVVTLRDVNEVITRMGRPEELSDDGEDHTGPAGEEAVKNEPFISVNLPKNKRLYRDTRNKVFGGVVSGLAEYLNWNCNIMRILLVVLAVCTYVFPFVIVYLLAWMIIPPAGNPRQILEMQGEPVTVDGVGRTVLENSATPPPYMPDSGGGFWSFVSQCLSILGKCIMALLLFVGSVVGVSAVVFLILGVTSLVMGLCYGNFALAASFGLHTVSPLIFSYQMWVMILASLVAIVPCVAIVWCACSLLFNKRGASAGVIVTAVVIEVLLIAALVIMCNLLNGTSDICMLAAAGTGLYFT